MIYEQIRKQLLKKKPPVPASDLRVMVTVPSVCDCEASPLFLYVMTDGYAVKVGITKDHTSRIKGVQTGNPRKIEVAALFSSIDHDTIKGSEKMAHHKLRMKRLQGEWFDVTVCEVISLCDEMFLGMTDVICVKRFNECV